jgi:hypothetical protein
MTPHEMEDLVEKHGGEPEIVLNHLQQRMWKFPDGHTVMYEWCSPTWVYEGPQAAPGKS